MFKSAYDRGYRQALRDAGIKLAEDDVHLFDDEGQQENPAEVLAAIFQEGGASRPPVVSPDNKTRVEESPGENDPHWGATQHGSNGAEALERSVPDFHMPGIGSV